MQSVPWCSKLLLSHETYCVLTYLPTYLPTTGAAMSLVTTHWTTIMGGTASIVDSTVTACNTTIYHQLISIASVACLRLENQLHHHRPPQFSS